MALRIGSTLEPSQGSLPHLARPSAFRRQARRKVLDALSRYGSKKSEVDRAMSWPG